ncbi:MAG: aminodeoxychorismate/anthranilate synthase component II [Bacteroidetes bacterium]|nr:aminodeoxychorismate/anthranilate synthase component II [Rhodothermia bacterium]MCS7155034.1 aminodeoxychorismate/anthranilate synthase component II [Bacteroidota bacterium]MCX7907318.1 aminodeoxychorismate/anthranilate synthase component II [Bacteroidota bacterium]MDW8137955.1 aminodeoxychorismate/anthranilate synthase component II [Bacteroidota bacterium]MDW8286193.1 aminodeoxychorismate/anthranilate synthase component II [Bacteroidota bacterium]
MIVVIDNYDSFTYNLVQLLYGVTDRIRVFRNDAVGLQELWALEPAGIVISPGPGRPHEAGITESVIAHFGGQVPILGVCLGHQAIGEVFGGRVVRAPRPLHGKTSAIYHDGQTIFSGLPNPFQATRYHSLVVERESLPPVLQISAWTADGLIMGLRHRYWPIEGVQFHPESVLTQVGAQLVQRWAAQVLRDWACAQERPS